MRNYFIFSFILCGIFTGFIGYMALAHNPQNEYCMRAVDVCELSGLTNDFFLLIAAAFVGGAIFCGVGLGLNNLIKKRS